ncbi:MAG: hypothetical protein WB557_07880, partial [Solirubrobacteraceae bacterium]
MTNDPVSPGTTFPTDEVLSSDSRYLYVVSPTLGMAPPPANPSTSHIDVYRVGPGGSLTTSRRRRQTCRTASREWQRPE